MSIKTPEQVARAALEEIGLDHLDDLDSWEHLERIVATAIKADRAQRKESFEHARASLDDYYEKSERDTFEAIDGMEWAQELADILDGIVREAGARLSEMEAQK